MYNICRKIDRSFGRLIMHPFSLALVQMICMIIFRGKFSKNCKVTLETIMGNLNKI